MICLPIPILITDIETHSMVRNEGEGYKFGLTTVLTISQIA